MATKSCPECDQQVREILVSVVNPVDSGPDLMFVMSAAETVSRLSKLTFDAAALFRRGSLCPLKCISIDTYFPWFGCVWSCLV